MVGRYNSLNDGRIMYKKLSLIALIACSSGSALASYSLFGFADNFSETRGVVSQGATHSFMTGSKDGVDLTISGWSSAVYGGRSECVDDGQTNVEAYDKCVHRAQLHSYGDLGLGIVNYDELDDEPNHSIDNNGLDFDMVLLSFSYEVNLSDIYTGWNYSYKNDEHFNFVTETNASGELYEVRTSGTAGASAMAYTGSEAKFNSARPFSETQSWQDTLSSGWKVINQDFKANGNSINTNGRNYNKLAITSTEQKVFSKYWLVGAAHNVARDAGTWTDHIKIAGVSFMKKPTTTDGSGGTPVNAPGSVGLFLAFAAVFAYRGKQK